MLSLCLVNVSPAWYLLLFNFGIKGQVEEDQPAASPCPVMGSDVQECSLVTSRGKGQPARSLGLPLRCGDHLLQRGVAFYLPPSGPGPEPVRARTGAVIHSNSAGAKEETLVVFPNHRERSIERYAVRAWLWLGLFVFFFQGP